MAFRTATASDFLDDNASFGLRGVLGYQDVNDEFLRGLTGFTRQGDFDLIASLGQRTSGDIRLGSGADLASDDDIVTGFAKAGFSASDEFSAGLSYQGFYNDAVEPDNGQGVSSGSPLNKSIESQQYSAELRWGPVSPIDLHFIPYHLQGSVEEADPVGGDVLIRDIETTGFTLDNRTPFTLGKTSGIITIGGEWYGDDQVGRDTGVVSGVRSGVPSGEDSFSGLFAQVEADVETPFGAPGTLTIIPGVRYDTYEASSTGNLDKEEHASSPKLAVTYQPDDMFFVFGNIGKAFRAPGINELYLSGVHFSVPHPILGPGVAVPNNFVPNPNLDPETSRFWEGGIGFEFGNLTADNDVLQIKASTWNQDVDDFIAQVVNTPPTFFTIGCFIPPFTIGCNVGTTTSINVDAELEGSEIQARYDSDRLLVQLGYGTIEATELATGFDVPGLPPDRFTASATLKLPEVGARLGVRAEFADDLDKNYNPTTSDPSSEIRDGYTVVDLFASWEPSDALLDGALPGLRVDLGVDNVADEDYERAFEGVSEPGRNFKILVGYTAMLDG
jgi:hemoglobin/transferrin/lactoferrin receptor protein